MNELGLGGGESGGTGWALGHSFLKVGGEKMKPEATVFLYEKHSTKCDYPQLQTKHGI